MLREAGIGGVYLGMLSFSKPEPYPVFSFGRKRVTLVLQTGQVPWAIRRPVVVTFNGSILDNLFLATLYTVTFKFHGNFSLDSSELMELSHSYWMNFGTVRSTWQ